MARLTKVKPGEQPEPPPSDDLELNLAFAPTKDLIEEIKKRCEAMVIAYALTDAMMESEPSDSNAHRKENPAGGYRRCMTAAFQHVLVLPQSCNTIF